MKFDNKEDIPEALQDKFVERDGVWMSQDMVDTLDSTKKTLNEVNDLRNGNKELAEQIEHFKKSESERKEAERKADEAKMTDAERNKLEAERRENREKELLAQVEEARNEIKAMQMKSIESESKSFSAQVKDRFGVTDGFEQAFTELYALKRTKVVDNEFTPTNSKGEAVDKDIDAIVKDLESDPMFSRMKKAPNSTPVINRNKGRDVHQIQKNKNLSDMSKEEKLAYHRQKINANN